MNEAIYMLDEPLSVLEHGGWSITRHIDVSSYIPLLEADGYVVSSAAIRFLESYGGLILLYRYNVMALTQYVEGEMRLRFDIEELGESIHPRRLAQYESILGAPLCLIGFWDGQYMPLVIAPSGEVYGCFEDVIVRCGHTGDEAVLNMLKYTGIETVHRGNQTEEL